jgi:hypothetical protein
MNEARRFSRAFTDGAQQTSVSLNHFVKTIFSRTLLENHRDIRVLSFPRLILDKAEAQIHHITSAPLERNGEREPKKIASTRTNSHRIVYMDAVLVLAKQIPHYPTTTTILVYWNAFEREASVIL